MVGAAWKTEEAVRVLGRGEGVEDWDQYLAMGVRQQGRGRLVGAASTERLRDAHLTPSRARRADRDRRSLYSA